MDMIRHIRMAPGRAASARTLLMVLLLAVLIVSVVHGMRALQLAS